ncbi:MAG: phosphatase PAP2 family protein [Elusimicrobia bacterium]|nr:phosphatase PAP2 family protein [Elusimicrobiota bacterium]
MRWDGKGWSLPRFIELTVASCALAAALALNNCAGRAADRAGELAHSSPDLLLSHLPVVDLRVLFVYGFAAFLVCVFGLGAWREGRRAAHILWLYAILVALRSVFITLTPMREPDGALQVLGDPLFDALGRHMTFKHDLFFSSHTAMPFLAFLSFRDRWARRLFLAFSVTMAATVLLTRVHYSIDVFAAFFITYAVYRFERRWLRVPYRRLRHRLLGGLLRPKA